MPATLFNPVADVICHTLEPLDPNVLQTLRPEEYLLVHSAPARASNDYVEEIDVNGNLCYAAWFNFKIRWSVTADALALHGLANYHPGAQLSTASLNFLNAARRPFLIPMTGQRRLVYENPTQDPEDGGLVACTFDVVSMFGDHSTVPGGGVVLPAAPELVGSLTPSLGGGADWLDLYGFSLIWLRKINLRSPVTDLLHLTNYEFWQTRSSGAPADYAAFRADVDSLPINAGKDDIIEVFACDIPGGRSLFLKPTEAPVILPRLRSAVAVPFPAPELNWFYESTPIGEEPGSGVTYSGGILDYSVTNVAQFLAGDHLVPGTYLTALFSFASLTWVEVPPPV